jgi:hypothetical protein
MSWERACNAAAVKVTSVLEQGAGMLVAADTMLLLMPVNQSGHTGMPAGSQPFRFQPPGNMMTTFTFGTYS